MGTMQRREVSFSTPWAGQEHPEQEHPGKECHAQVYKTELLINVAKSD